MERSDFVEFLIKGQGVVFNRTDPYDGYQGDCTVWRVKCLECKSIIQRRTKEEAIEAWNRRAK